MSHNGNKATEMKLLNNDAPVAIGDEKPVPPNGIKLWKASSLTKQVNRSPL